MSQLWRDQLQVFFAPDRVDLVRSLHGIKLEETPKQLITRNQSQNMPGLEMLLIQFEEMLIDVERTDMTMTISNHYIRYVVLPPQVDIIKPDEVLAYADFRMREVYEQQVDAWVLSVSAWNPTSGAICAAMPRNLLTRLQELTDRHRIKLKGIVPYLVSAFDHWHTLLDDKQTCFALIESGRICIALMMDGIWQVIRNQRILQRVEDELLAALDQEAVFVGQKQALDEVRIFAPEHPGLVLPDGCGWKLVPVQTENVVVPSHYPSAVVDVEETDTCVA